MNDFKSSMPLAAGVRFPERFVRFHFDRLDTRGNGQTRRPDAKEGQHTSVLSPHTLRHEDGQ